MPAASNATVLFLPKVPRHCQVPINVGAYLSEILDSANSLLKDGLEVLSFSADITAPRPSMWVKDCPFVRNLARVGVASYVRTGHDMFGMYKVGEFRRFEVDVFWIERVMQ